MEAQRGLPGPRLPGCCLVRAGPGVEPRLDEAASQDGPGLQRAQQRDAEEEHGRERRHSRHPGVNVIKHFFSSSLSTSPNKLECLYWESLSSLV